MLFTSIKWLNANKSIAHDDDKKYRIWIFLIQKEKNLEIGRASVNLEALPVELSLFSNNCYSCPSAFRFPDNPFTRQSC